METENEKLKGQIRELTKEKKKHLSEITRLESEVKTERQKAKARVSPERSKSPVHDDSNARSNQILKAEIERLENRNRDMIKL